VGPTTSPRSGGARSGTVCRPSICSPTAILGPSARRAGRHGAGARSATTVLLAPRGEHRSCTCGEPLIAAFLGAGMRVILRPHYQTARLAPRVVAGLVARSARPGLSPRRPDGGARLAAGVRRPRVRLVRHGDRVRPRPRQAGALRRRAAPRAESEVRGARPGADGVSHPPGAGPRPAARTRGRGAAIRERPAP
jgi:hypothetical protein